MPKREKEIETPLWVSENGDVEIPHADSDGSSVKLQKPTGWSNEQYRLWLESEMPDGWTLVQWVVFSGEQIELLDHQEKEKKRDPLNEEMA